MRAKSETLVQYIPLWYTEILPFWETKRNDPVARRMVWWFGIPEDIRGQIWKKAIGDDLAINEGMYRILHLNHHILIQFFVACLLVLTLPRPIILIVVGTYFFHLQKAKKVKRIVDSQKLQRHKEQLQQREGVQEQREQDNAVLLEHRSYLPRETKSAHLTESTSSFATLDRSEESNAQETEFTIKVEKEPVNDTTDAEKAPETKILGTDATGKEPGCEKADTKKAQGTKNPDTDIKETETIPSSVSVSKNRGQIQYDVHLHAKGPDSSSDETEEPGEDDFVFTFVKREDANILPISDAIPEPVSNIRKQHRKSVSDSLENIFSAETIASTLAAAFSPTVSSETNPATSSNSFDYTTSSFASTIAAAFALVPASTTTDSISEKPHLASPSPSPMPASELLDGKYRLSPSRQLSRLKKCTPSTRQRMSGYRSSQSPERDSEPKKTRVILTTSYESLTDSGTRRRKESMVEIIGKEQTVAEIGVDLPRTFSSLHLFDVCLLRLSC